MPLLFQPKILRSGNHCLEFYLVQQDELQMTWENTDYVQALTSRMIEAQSCSLSERLISIIEDQTQALQAITEQAACVVLLPEMDGQKNTASVVNALKQAFLPMQSGSLTLIYPYGHASFLMALRKIESLANQHLEQGVWVIGLDTALAFCQQDTCITQMVACVDSLFVLKATSHSRGLNPVWTQMDAAVGGKSTQECVRFLFRASIQSVPHVYESLWLPMARTDDVENDWIHEFHFLHNNINTQTHHHFTEYQVGDLGVNLALFKTLKIMNALSKSQNNEHYCLQMDIADNAHLSAAVFNWCD